MANVEPAGNPTVSVLPSSVWARELCSNAPRDGWAATTRFTTSDHLRCRSPGSLADDEDEDEAAADAGAAFSAADEPLSGAGSDVMDPEPVGDAGATAEVFDAVGGICPTEVDTAVGAASWTGADIAAAAEAERVDAVAPG